MPILVTESTIPSPTTDNLLVVEPLNGSPVPVNRLPVGVYYVQSNEFKNPNWQNLANILAPSLKKLLFPNQVTIKAQTIPALTIIMGTNTIPHDLGARPNIIQFWQGDSWFVAGFYTRATATNLIIESTGDYADIEIDLIKF